MLVRIVKNALQSAVEFNTQVKFKFEGVTYTVFPNGKILTSIE